MSDLRELYMEMVTDHAKNPRHRGKIEPCDYIGHGHNPLCGDIIIVTLALDGNIITDVKFDGEGCAISTASSDLMADAILGKTVDETKALFRRFHELITEEGSAEGLGKLAVFEGVREFPMRVKCATLAWHTLISALDKTSEATTE